MTARVVDTRHGFARTLLTNASSLMGTTLVTSILGYAFWVIAARVWDAPAVGFAAAVISALTFLAMLGKVGLGTLLIGELRRYPGAEGRLLTSALLASGVVGLTLGAGFALAAPWLAPGMADLAASPLAVGVFGFSVAATATALVLDEAVVGLLRGSVQLVRNVAFAAWKLVVLVVLALVWGDAAGGAIYVAWPVATVLSLALAAYLLRDLAPRARRPAHGASIESTAPPAPTENPGPLPTFDRLIVRSALLHHALTFLGQAPGLAMPVVVAALVSVAGAAYLFVAYTIASLLTAVSSSLTTALFATGARDPRGFPRQLRLSLVVAIGGGLLGILGVYALGDLVLAAFGAGYPAEAGPVLRVLVLSVVPVAIKTHFGAIARVHGRLGIAAAAFGVAAVFELAGAVVGARAGGLLGLAVAWVAVQSIEAILLAGPVLRELRRDDGRAVREASLDSARRPRPHGRR